MSLDLARLEKPRRRGGKIVARCPACAEEGRDVRGDHLTVWPDGRFACILHRGRDGEAHRKRVFALCGDRVSMPRSRATVGTNFSKRAAVRLPELRTPTPQELTQIAYTRCWTETTGLQEISRRGLLWCGDVFDNGKTWPAWIVTDASRRNAQARRLDGMEWTGIDAKAKTLPGSDPSWPIGVSAIDSCSHVLLCEGGPDFLASLYVAGCEGADVSRIAPICLTGAGIAISTDALALLSGKYVRICIHDDSAGMSAARRWADELYKNGAAKVSGVSFRELVLPDGSAVKDLADFARLLDADSSPPHVITVSGWEGISAAAA